MIRTHIEVQSHEDSATASVYEWDEGENLPLMRSGQYIRVRGVELAVVTQAVLDLTYEPETPFPIQWIKAVRVEDE